jgi:MoaA/NifB/PqqE/SkfB family radical SAM enzyme
MVQSGVKAVVLIGGGEPLAHPEIGWVIEYLAQNDVQVGITTNGLLIDRYMDCIAEHASWVRVSMDAALSDTYNFFRPSPSGKSMFNKAIENMQKLAEIKTGKLGYSFLILTEGEFDKDTLESGQNNVVSVARSNVPEIYKAAVLAKEIGCDYFEIKPEYDIHHYSVVQKEVLMKQAKELINKSRTLQDDNFFVLEATKLNHVLNGEPNEEPKDYNRCAVSQLRTLVTPSGVYVCPYFRGNEKQLLGDVNKISFSEMWNSDTRKKVMNTLDPSKDCRFHCIRHDSNQIIEDHISGVATLDVVDDFDNFV